jgi:hypothetical protein
VLVKKAMLVKKAIKNTQEKYYACLALIASANSF